MSIATSIGLTISDMQASPHRGTAVEGDSVMSYFSSELVPLFTMSSSRSFSIIISATKRYDIWISSLHRQTNRQTELVSDIELSSAPQLSGLVINRGIIVSTRTHIQSRCTWWHATITCCRPYSNYYGLSYSIIIIITIINIITDTHPLLMKYSNYHTIYILSF